LPWLLKQDTDVIACLFAFCVAATLDSVSATESAHPINALANVMQIDMAYYWKPTPQSYLNRVSKARIINVVTEAVTGIGDGVARHENKRCRCDCRTSDCRNGLAAGGAEESQGRR
jgi:hypothetical protein